MKRITRKFEFDSGHRVMRHESKCRNIHGHRYVAEITVQSEELDELGRVVDFGVLKKVIGSWIDTYLDHCYIANPKDPAISLLVTEDWKFYTMPQCRPNPTAENLAEELGVRSIELLDGTGLEVYSVRLFETPNCWADWGNQNARD